MAKKGLTKGEEYRLKALSYIDRVMSGERPAGKYERLAVERHLNDLKMAMEKGIYFDDAAARRYLSFCQLIKHFEGEWAGQEFIPEDWQCFILYSIFGWKTKDGVRRFRYAAVEVPRKNGKTTLAAIIALIGMIADGESGAQVYSAAVDKDQAGICWNAAGQMISRSKKLSQVCKVWKTSITYEETASFYKPLSKETKNKDGLNPHFAICDEMHAWPTDDIYNLITSGMGARKQPLIFIITTAGFNKESPYFKMRKVYIDILEGVKTDENTFAIIYCPDEGDDWHDRATWYKASPNLGVSVKESFMEIEYQNAINKGGTHEVSFKTKNLNMWVDAPDVWISDDLVVRCDHGTTDDMLDGQKCWGAIDLASHMDINALALYFPEQEYPAMKFFFWIPEAKVKEKEDRVDYRTWVSEGWIKITPGNVIDINYLVRDVSEILLQYNMQSLAFDPAKAYHGVIQGLMAEGFDDILDEFNQSMRNMSEPTKELESLVASGKLDLMQNPVIRWMFRNVAIYRDANENIKIDKKRSSEKVDGCVAAAMAIGTNMSYEDNDISNVGVAYVSMK